MPKKNVTITRAEIDEYLTRIGVPEDADERTRFEGLVRLIAQAKPPPGGFGKKLKAEREARKRAKGG